jgi:cobalt/nickel transport system permease protein
VCVSAIVILTASTPFHVLCSELRRLRLPAILCLQLALCYRYIAVFSEETNAMLVSYNLRLKTSGVPVKKYSIRLKDAGPFLGSLLLRSFGRAGEVWQAMRLRGFNGSFRAGPRPLHAADFFYCAIVCGVCIAVRVIYAA